MSAFPACGSLDVVVPAMRAAAGLLERAGVAGLSVTCDDTLISVQVGQNLGDAPARAAALARLAAVLGTTALQSDSPGTAASWLKAHGVIGGIPVHVYTHLAVRTRPGHEVDGPGVALAPASDGQQTELAPGSRLPAGWRWITELDEPGTGQTDRPQVT
jgi:hypothetical protein